MQRASVTVHHCLATHVPEGGYDTRTGQAMAGHTEDRRVSMILPQRHAETVGLTHFLASSCYPQTNGKIEPHRRSLKERVLVVVHTTAWELANEIASFVGDYNAKRYHQAFGNASPDQVYYGRREGILKAPRTLKTYTFAVASDESHEGAPGQWL